MKHKSDNLKITHNMKANTIGRKKGSPAWQGFKTI